VAAFDGIKSTVSVLGGLNSSIPFPVILPPFNPFVEYA